MKFYLLIFDRQQGKAYKGFHADLIAHPRIFRWWHYIKSSYIVGTDLTADELSTHARLAFDKHGIRNTHLTIRVKLSDHQGMLTKDAWAWINKQVIEGAEDE